MNLREDTLAYSVRVIKLVAVESFWCKYASRVFHTIFIKYYYLSWRLKSTLSRHMTLLYFRKNADISHYIRIHIYDIIDEKVKGAAETKRSRRRVETHDRLNFSNWVKLDKFLLWGVSILFPLCSNI